MAKGHKIGRPISRTQGRALAWLAAHEPACLFPRECSMAMVHKLVGLGLAEQCDVRSDFSVDYRRTEAGRALTPREQARECCTYDMRQTTSCGVRP